MISDTIVPLLFRKVYYTNLRERHYYDRPKRIICERHLAEIEKELIAYEQRNIQMTLIPPKEQENGKT